MALIRVGASGKAVLPGSQRQLSRNTEKTAAQCSIPVPEGVAAGPPAEAVGLVRHRFKELNILPPPLASPPQVQRLESAGPAGAAQPSGTQIQELARQGIRGRAGSLPYLETIQSAFGRHDVRAVRAHVDQAAASAAESMGAEAFAVGQHVAFAGPPTLHTVAHEAAHVIQQRGGVHLSGGVGKPGDRYEQQADAIADELVQGRSVEHNLDAIAPATGSPAPSGTAPVQAKLQLDNKVWQGSDFSTSTDPTMFQKLSSRLLRAMGGRPVTMPLWRKSGPLQVNDAPKLLRLILNDPNTWSFDPALNRWTANSTDEKKGETTGSKRQPIDYECRQALSLFDSIAKGEGNLQINESDNENQPQPGFKREIMLRIWELLFIESTDGQDLFVSPSAFSLLSELARGRHITFIRPHRSVEGGKAVPSNMENADKPEFGSGCTVWMDPALRDDSFAVWESPPSQQENEQKAKPRKASSMPVYILLGHELIHARRVDQGRYTSKKDWNALPESTLPLDEYRNVEEYDTIERGDITENKLRAEHGLPPRFGHKAPERFIPSDTLL